MVWVAVVVALLLAAAALAVSYIARREIAGLSSALSWCTTELQRRDTEVASLQNDVGLAGRKLEFAEKQLKVSRENLDEAVEKARQQAEQLAYLSRRADAHFLTADADAVEATRLVTELEHYAVDSLEQEAAGSRPRILRGGLYAQRPVLDLVPDLVDGFLTELKAGLMYRQADRPHGSRFYLRWPGDLPSPELVLDTMLKAADASPQQDEQPGTAELRTLLHALHAGSPCLLFIGPVVVERSATGTSAGIASPGWHGPTDAQKKAALDGSGPGLLSQIGASRVVDWEVPLTA